jgi:tRNA-splicing ligase RtcB
VSARIEAWLPEPASRDLEAGLARLARTEDVVHVAVMPDAHVSEDVCVGTVTATRRRLLPAAVGGDIGCGMAVLGFEGSADLLADPHRAARVLAGLRDAVPPLTRASAAASLPAALAALPLSAPALEARRDRDGRLELGTLGRGNHFLELQRDDEGALWLMVHSGSRALGPAIRHHHEARAPRDRSGLAFLEAESDAGRAYLADAAFAAEYARLSRRAMVEAAASVVADVLGIGADAASFLECDHNHVRCEAHGGELLWVHRKGAMRLGTGERGVVPGSMGSPSFHVEGRGHPGVGGQRRAGQAGPDRGLGALCSSAHGAGRALSRAEARRRIGAGALLREVSGVWFDHRLADRLREEAPSAYKDIGAVMRAQRDLVKILRRLSPVLAYKAA